MSARQATLSARQTRLRAVAADLQRHHLPEALPAAPARFEPQQLPVQHLPAPARHPLTPECACLDISWSGAAVLSPAVHLHTELHKPGHIMERGECGM